MSSGKTNNDRDASVRKWTRRQLLKTAAVGGAAQAAGVSPSLAAAGRTWSPELRTDRNDYFIIDGVVHCYNHMPANYRDPVMRGKAHEGGYAYSVHAAVNPQPYTLTAAQWARDWQPEEVVEQAFLESDTHMICMHSVPLFTNYFDGLVSNPKGAYLKNRYPDRVVWYAGIDIMDDPVKVFRLIDQVAQQGADGIKLYPYRVNQDTNKPEWWYMDDEVRAFQVFEYVLSKGIKHIATHKLIGYQGEHTPYMTAGDFAGAAEAFPEAWFHIVHAGWFFLEETIEVLKRFENTTAVMEGPMFWAAFDVPKFTKLLSTYLNQVDLNRIIYASAAANQHPYFVTRAILDYEPPEGSDFKWGDHEKYRIMGANFADIHGIDIEAQRKKIAGDKFELIKQQNGMREPFSEQRKPGAWQT
jgi:predicted TIM-barrel fold metal-dependent hydrolase